MRKISINPEAKRRATVIIMTAIVIFGAVGYSLKYRATETVTYNSAEHYDMVRDYMQSEYTAVFSPYYDMTYVTELANYKENFNEKNGKITAEFIMKAVYKNYYKDPDTVKYIIDAKNSGNTEEYKRLYNEYNAEKEANFPLKLEGKIKDSAVLCKKLYSDDNNGGWRELKEGLNDYIISDE
ncbi:MAG: hypothetical protein PUE13_01005 [Clostridiales bacterium]|nr:hypothetical protein [Clostridiales bacterium]